MKSRERNVEKSIEKLRELRRQFKTGAADYRALVRDTMANVMEIVLKLRSDKFARERFLELAKIKQGVAHDE